MQDFTSLHFTALTCVRSGEAGWSGGGGVIRNDISLVLLSMTSPPRSWMSLLMGLERVLDICRSWDWVLCTPRCLTPTLSLESMTELKSQVDESIELSPPMTPSSLHPEFSLFISFEPLTLFSLNCFGRTFRMSVVLLITFLAEEVAVCTMKLPLLCLLCCVLLLGISCKSVK